MASKRNLDRVLSAVSKKLGAGSAGKLSGGALSQVTEVVPTGIPALDRWVLGIGGFPVGRLTELFSMEGGGKSSLVYQAIGNLQAEGTGVALLWDAEQSLDEGRLRLFGVDPDALGLIGAETPLCMEEGVEGMVAALSAIPDGVGPNLLAWDSIASTLLQGERDGTLEDPSRIGWKRAQTLGGACRRLGPLAAKKRTALLFVNQLRISPGVAFGDPTYTPGGKAVPFLASVRLRFVGGRQLKHGDNVLGIEPIAKTQKNKHAPPFREARVRLSFRRGWDREWPSLNLAKDWELVAKDEKDPAAALSALQATSWTPPSLLKAEPLPDPVEAEP